MNLSGFEEVPHTADWALKVWAPDFPGLMIEAACGMNALMGVRIRSDQSWTDTFDLTAIDRESMLVAFLNRILLEMEVNQAGFDQFFLEHEDLKLTARLRGAPLEAIQKVIKAVTFHNLRIVPTDADGLEAVIVFDV